MKLIDYSAVVSEFISNAFESKSYRKALEDLASNIREYSSIPSNESTIVTNFILKLFDAIKSIFGVCIEPQTEVPTRYISRGRIDSKIGAVIFEFKDKDELSTTKKQAAAVTQLKQYIDSLSFENPGSKYLGIVTNGILCSVLECNNGVYEETSFNTLSKEHLDVIIRSIIQSQTAALTSDNLLRDFCSNDENSISTKLAIALFESYKSEHCERSEMLFSEWKQLFNLAHDDISKQAAIEERKKSLELVFGRKFSAQDEEYLALFSLQTTYAILIKIIAFKVVSKIRFSRNEKFSDYIYHDNDTLGRTMRDLENGSIFRSYGIGNLLEGDFFSWYATQEQWTDKIAKNIKSVFEVLSHYEDKPIFENGDNVIDLFKELFLTIIPDKVRHSLGEYYTPMWLADNLVESAINKLDVSKQRVWRGLDPCAGSGTFVVVMIRKILQETVSLPASERLRSVLSRVNGIDLNPLAVLTTRINYFINVAPLITDEEYIEIPVYLGDSSNIPATINEDGIDYLTYSISTLRGPFEIKLPKSTLKDKDLFSIQMSSIEDMIKLNDQEGIDEALINLVAEGERTEKVINLIHDLSARFIELENQHWNGIWARIITNYLTTACLGHFDLVVGNPPWIDWKSLPTGYRDRVKNLCIDHDLFSGDSITGGINLNICALITNVTANMYLDARGILAFLMPQTILFQQSYEGFRRCQLSDGSRLYIQEIYDWTKAGHPFYPVQEPFLTYFYSRDVIDYKRGVPTTLYTKKKSVKQKLSDFTQIHSFTAIKKKFTVSHCLVGQVNSDSSIFSYAENIRMLKSFAKIAGECEYIGREGVEFYPQELFLLEVDDSLPKRKGLLPFVNYQNKKSKYKIPRRSHMLEPKYMQPLVKGVDIERFHLNDSSFVVPFPYDSNHTRVPLSLKELRKESPKLASYFMEFKTIIDSQTSYNERIIGTMEKEFYALARVGEYSFGEHFVAFRDNTKWQACVVSSINTSWGGPKKPCFQNHAVTMSQDLNGNYMTKDEAHYVCAILNAPIVKKYLFSSSDSRSFKIRPPVYIPKYNPKDKHHKQLASLSEQAHLNFNNDESMTAIDAELDKAYVALCSKIRKR